VAHKLPQLNGPRNLAIAQKRVNWQFVRLFGLTTRIPKALITLNMRRRPAIGVLALVIFGCARLSSLAAPSRYAFGLSLSQYLSMSLANASEGYRPISVDANGSTNSPRIAAVWINDGFTNWTAVTGVTSPEYSNQVTSLTSQGYRTLSVDAYGDYPNERYIAVWVKDSQVAAGWGQVFNLTEAAYNTAWNNYASSGYRPVWISVLASNSTPRFSGVWVKDGNGFWTYWNMNAAGLASNVTNILGQGGRPISLSGYSPSGSTQFAGHWIYAEQPVWTWNSELTAGAFQSAATTLSNANFRPVFINEYGSAASPRYASAWVQDPLPPTWTIAGVANPNLAALDTEMTNYMALRNIARGTLAVTRNGKLVFHHAYTFAPTNAAPTQTTNLFRIASLSKQFTSAGVMQLLQAGKLSLDQQISTILDLSSVSDARFRTVTIRQLLQHWGGWDRGVSYDPMFRDFIISSTLSRPLPTTQQMVIDYMKSQPLDHTPGTVYAYSNFGYCLLGRIMEILTGMTYEQYMQANVLAPAGIWDMRLGKSLLTNADPAEVDYDDPLRRLVPTVMGTNGPSVVPIQYGGWNFDIMDSHGGWLATASDLVRFSSCFDAQTNSPLLSSQWIDTMWSQPPEIPGSPSTYYGAGWLVRPLGGGTYNAWHDGSLDGTFSYTVRLANGICWAVIFNRRSVLSSTPDYYAIDAEVNNAIASVSTWPAYDLFDANGDGILDAWQIHYFGSISSPAAAPSADPDGDGVNNLNEYINLTDPSNPASVEKLFVNLDPQNNQRVVLDWPAARGRSFAIETTTNISAPNWQPMAGATNIIGDNTTRHITNSVSGSSFYRLRAQLQR
jgi:CubicO group peptidase (beta-lactamase class C family)